MFEKWAELSEFFWSNLYLFKVKNKAYNNEIAYRTVYV